MNRRLFLAGGLATLAACKGKGGGGGGVTGPSSGVRAPSHIGYSRVGSMSREQAQACARAGLRLLQAEPFGAGVPGTWPPSETNSRRCRDAAEVMRGVDGVLIVTVLNANDSNANQPDQWFLDRIDEVKSVVGVANVWLAGVEEPDAGADRAKMLRWVRWGIERWPGTSVVNQSGTSVGGGLVDVHYCSMESMLSSLGRGHELHSTDCRPIDGSTLGEADVRRLTQEAVRHRARMLIFDNGSTGFRQDVIAWMGDEITKASKGG